MRFTEYQDIGVLHVHRLDNRATIVPYAARAQALTGKRAASPYYLDLNGDWEFKLFDRVEDLPDDIGAALAFDRIQVPGCWQMQGYGFPQYTNAAYPIPYDPPFVSRENQVGWYRRRFTLPARFDGRLTRVRFEGVDSAFYVYVNGAFAGFSKCPHMPAEFDITPFLRDGENELNALVMQYSDGTYLEDQDMWRMSGIFRDVMLLSFGQARIADIRARADYLPDTRGGVLRVEADVFSADSVLLTLLDGGATVFSQELEVKDDRAVLERDLASVTPWSAEDPHRYTLLCEIPGQVERVDLGFTRVEVKDRQFFVNGVSVKLKGVNRHDTHAALGHFTPYDVMELDVRMMKRHNVNCVRTSHYPNDPRFLDLCDEYGLYVVDEADLECHGVNHLGNYHLLATDPLWEKQFVDRGVRMVMRDRNHPCVVIWSLGNESGYGCNHEAMANAMRALDPSRPIHYHSHLMFWNAEASDFASYMYTDFEQIDKYLKSKDPRPYFLCEYAHAMGQGPGTLEDYWQKIYANKAFIGGCVWEFVDHACVKYKDGKPYYAYGGDFGEYPHSGHFCVDALMFPDRTPHTGLTEYAHVLRPVRARLTDEARGVLRVRNYYAFTSLSALRAAWRVEYLGKTVAQGEFETKTNPGRESAVTLPLGEYPQGSYLNIDWALKKDTPWANAGFVVAGEQIALSLGAPAAKIEAFPGGALTLARDKQTVFVRSDDFALAFDVEGLCSFVGKGVELLKAGLRVNIWRALTDNDRRLAREWQKLGIDKLLCRNEEMNANMDGDDACVTLVNVYAPKSARAVVRVTQAYRVTRSGAVALRVTYEPLQEGMPHLPRLGMRFVMPRAFERMQYFGRGPFENYPDKKTAARVGLYDGLIADNHEPYVFPQENGSHQDARFARFLRAGGMGLEIAGEGFSFSAHHYTQESLDKAEHTYDIGDEGLTEVCFDGVMGPLGSASCGPQAPEKDRLYLTSPRAFSFTLRAVDMQAEA